jgi:hypothetical protein
LAEGFLIISIYFLDLGQNLVCALVLALVQDPPDACSLEQ